ncbi:glycosyltransferase family 2 protein [Ancylobacter amanitiformis]|uniref:Glycosyltransferase n=1 Tax=Ancylobacter amanitiformis TaxID=217069 RepID=A0ABU0LWL0_9HYPH|nr:glycosyltransferase family 2 protein [Ancylobacter amanitiformis]MDQ0513083.1 putative glycosyltransferase [Ancylobacter amanitiformis]
MKLSIVTTLYRSEPHIVEFCDRALAAARAIASDVELVIVNDGSPDRAFALARDYARTHPGLVVVDLSRNFGHHPAMMAGLRQATGDLVFLIDSDLEEEPEWLARFLARLTESGADVVYGVQETRRGGVVDRIGGHVYYALFRLLSGLDIPANLVTARLMTRRYVDALVSFEERELDIAGLWVLSGFEQVAIPVIKHSSSPTTYSILHKIRLMIDSITSFSNTPLVAIFNIGLTIFFGSMLWSLYLLVNWLFLDTPLSGWTSVMMSIWILGGMIISFIGVIGIYLAKVFSETKRRPSVIVRDIVRSAPP